MAYVSFGKSSNKATALGSSANVDKVYFPTDDNSIIMGKKIYGKSTWFGTCSTPATTAAKVVDCENFVLTLGCIIGVKFTYSSNASNCTLNVNNTGAKLVWYNNAVFTGNSNSVFGYANRIVYYMYDGTYWVWLNYSTLDGNTLPSAYITTASNVAEKYAACTNYAVKDPSYLHVLITQSNTAVSALTLSVNSLATKPIYINGLPSSATNYDLPKGTYLVRYENGIYWFNTNDIAPIKVSKDNVKYETVTVSDMFTSRVTANGLHFSGKLAHIDRIKGNTIVWNLLVENGDFSNGTSGWNRGSGFASMSVSNNILTAVNNPGNQYNNSISRTASITLGHKYYVSFWFCGSIEKSIYVLFANDKTEAAFTINSRTPVQCNAVVTANYNTSFLLKLANGAHTSEDWFKFKNIVLMDLTLMFGKGNEPTKEEFEALFPNPYYTYETGRLCSFDDSIKTNGFNLWDELWELGNINESTGAITSGSYVIPSNFINVFPNSNYYVSGPEDTTSVIYRIYYYDKDFNLLSYSGTVPTSFTTPDNCYYIKFRCTGGYTEYNNTICINLSDPLSNGTYKPYWTSTKSIDIKSLTSNGEVIFPEGLLSAGEVYDEIVGNKAIKRVGMVDLGSLSWTARGDIKSGCFGARIADRKIATDQKFNAVCKKYVIVEDTLSAGSNINYYISDGAVKDLLMAGYYNSNQSDNTNHTIYIVDTQFGTNDTSFTASLQGLILYYELETPIEYTIDLNINHYFKAEALGYELLSTIDRTIPASSPASMDITYGIDEEEYTNDLIYNTINTNNSSLTSYNGGTVYVEKYSKTNLYIALTTAINSNDAYCEFDCTYFTGTATFPNTITINKPCSIKFGNITITSQGLNFFNITSSNVLIIGYGRLSDRTNTTVPNATVLVMGLDSVCNYSDKGYHIYSKGNKNLRFEYLTLKGLRTTLGRLCGNNSYPIDGCGGIYIEKLNPLASMSGNTCNNIIINLLLIDGSKAHGIYLGLPILSTITNTRLSLIAGHGIFVNEGTSLNIDNVYVSSASLAGFCISGVSYCTLTNCVAEYTGIGFLTRASFNISIFSPGCEELTYLGTNPWAGAYAVTSKYGFNIQTSGYTLDSNTGNYSVAGTAIVSDVNDELYNAFTGTPFVISGGRGISLFTPYATGIAANYKTGLTSLYDLRRSCLCRVIGNARKVFLNNISGAKKSDETTKWGDIYNDIRVESTSGGSPDGVEIVYDVTNPLITHEHNVYVTPYDATYAPVYIVPSAQNVVVRNGGTFYTLTTFDGGIRVLSETDFLDTLLAPLVRVGNVILDGTDDSVKIVTLEESTITTPITIESGSIGLNSGDITDNSSYARTATAITYTSGLLCLVSIPNKPEGYNVRLFRYNADDSYIGYNDLGRVAPDAFSIIGGYLLEGLKFKVRFETSHPEYISFSTITTLNTEITKAKLNLDSQNNPVVNGIILKDTEYYHIKDDEDIYPISHPDISTQPSLLPLKFGSYKMYEVASRLENSNIFIVQSKNITAWETYPSSGTLFASTLKFGTNAINYNGGGGGTSYNANINTKVNVLVSNANVLITVDNNTVFIIGNQNYSISDILSKKINIFIDANKRIDFLLSSGFYYVVLSDITDLYLPYLKDVSSGAVIVLANSFNTTNTQSATLVKKNNKWYLNNFTFNDFSIPDYVLCQYYLKSEVYYYAATSGDNNKQIFYILLPNGAINNFKVGDLRLYGTEWVLPNTRYWSESTTLKSLTYNYYDHLIYVGLSESASDAKLIFNDSTGLISMGSTAETSLTDYFNTNEIEDIVSHLDSKNRLIF